MTPKNNIGVVWQLLFTREEEEKIISLLNRHRLPPDKTGLKLYILGKLGKTSEIDLSPEMQSLIEKGMQFAGSYIRKKVSF